MTQPSPLADLPLKRKVAASLTPEKAPLPDDEIMGAQVAQDYGQQEQRLRDRIAALQQQAYPKESLGKTIGKAFEYKIPVVGEALEQRDLAPRVEAMKELPTDESQLGSLARGQLSGEESLQRTSLAERMRTDAQRQTQEDILSRTLAAITARANVPRLMYTGQGVSRITPAGGAATPVMTTSGTPVEGHVPAPLHDAFNEWLANPSQYKAFATMEAQLKNAYRQQSPWAKIMPIYAAQKLLQTAYNDNPALLPGFSKMISQMFSDVGEPVPADIQQAMSQTPSGMPVDTSGTAQGLSVYSKTGPTMQQRNRGQFARDAITYLHQDVYPNLDKIAGHTGPVTGYLRSMLGHYGLLNDPQFLGYMTNSELMKGAIAAIHFGGRGVAEQFQGAIEYLMSPRQPADVLRSNFQQFERLLTIYARAGGRSTTQPLLPGESTAHQKLNQKVQGAQLPPGAVLDKH